MAESPLDQQIRRILAKAEQARSGGRRENGELRPLGKKARRTRSALLQAAYEQFTATSYAATSVQDIHEAAGVSLGTFYQYFREKADVIATLTGELIIKSSAELFRPFALDVGIDFGTHHAVEPFVRHYAATADFQRVWEEVTHIEPDVAAIRWEVTELIDSGLRDGIVAAQQKGQIDPSLDAQSTSRALNAMVDRYCYRVFVVEGQRDRASVDRVVAHLGMLWDRVLASA